MTIGDPRPAGDVFAVSAFDTENGRKVGFAVAGVTVDLDMELDPHAARWLAYELWVASGLPWPPPIRLVRKNEATPS